MTHRVSTNFTLFLKLFFTPFWAVFFGLFTLFVLFYSQSEILFLQSPLVKSAVFLVYSSFFIFFYFTLWQLRRVELGEDDYHVSNYFTTYRLIYSDIKYIRETPMLKWTLVRIELKGKGKVGKRVFFLANKDLYRRFFEEYPGVKENWQSLLQAS